MSRALQALTAPLAGRTTASGPIGAQSFGDSSSLLVNDERGSTVAWCTFDEELFPVLIQETNRPYFMTYRGRIVARSMRRGAL